MPLLTDSDDTDRDGINPFLDAVLLLFLAIPIAVVWGVVRFFRRRHRVQLVEEDK